jgi:transposase-like protein
MIVALSIGRDGRKSVVGLREGATEDATVAKRKIQAWTGCSGS